MLVAQASAAIDLTSVEKLAGQWDLSLNDTNRRCRLVLRADEAGPSLALAMPAGCRRAMPLLTEVGGWKLQPGDHVSFADAHGKEVLAFLPEGDGPLLAKGPEGETYRLSAAESSAQGQRFGDLPAVQVPGFETPAPAPAPLTIAATTAPAASSVKPDEIAGRYSVLREGGKDTGCMITLDAKARGLKGGNKALLAPACRDQGIVIFDPVGWAMEKGKLKLTARKGHHALFEQKGDGTWEKEPKEGKALSLKKM
ncbi:MAG: AprI/Inh family metalloprotease inhibitor [Methylobacteriaceae bacterium]|nr:AprI/Inh family metalloprotease inhibitor [Methylobacteriaceae bacterium]MBV9394003.1 AprI/Inh family metalloprotease inhibitor [Methylobacteriaceae bacterium]